MALLTAVSAGAIILREIDGELKIALAHHRRSSKTWSLPKGHVEPGETLEQTAVREVHEETGLATIQLIRHLGSFVRKSMKGNNELHKTIHFYLAYALTSDKPQPPLDASFTDVEWFSPKKVLELLHYEQDRAFLKEHLGLLLK